MSGNHNRKSFPKEEFFSLRFGGGANTAKTVYDLAPNEGEIVENVRVDPDRMSLRPRPRFMQLFDTADNIPGWTAPIRSIIPLPLTERSGEDHGDGQFLVQDSGGNVYHVQQISTNRWYVDASLTGGSVDSSSILVGGEHTYSEVLGYMILTDLNKQEPVKKVVFSPSLALEDLDHNLDGSGGQDVDFYAAHCVIENERAWFADCREYNNTTTTDTDLSHFIVASAVIDQGDGGTPDRSGPENISISTKPASAVAAGDPFYLTTPDLKKSQGLVTALGSIVIPTENGRTFIISGSTPSDFAISQLFPDSGVRDKQNCVFAGNDVLLYRNGRLDTLAGIEAFGDVSVDDLTRPIRSEFQRTDRVSLVYDPFARTIMVHPDGEEYAWIYHLDFRDQQAKDVSLLRQGDPVSGWVKWTSDAGGFFQYFDDQSLLTNVISNPAYSFVLNATGRPSSADVMLFAHGEDGDDVLWLDYKDFTGFGNYEEDVTLEGTSGATIAGGDPFTCKFRSKMVEAPSGDSFTKCVARVKYTPRWTDGTVPDLTVKLLLAGKKHRTITKTVELTNHDESTTEANADLTPRHKEITFPLSPGDAFQIELEFDGKYNVEILGVDFYVKG